MVKKNAPKVWSHRVWWLMSCYLTTNLQPLPSHSKGSLLEWSDAWNEFKTFRFYICSLEHVWVWKWHSAFSHFRTGTCPLTKATDVNRTSINRTNTETFRTHKNILLFLPAMSIFASIWMFECPLHSPYQTAEMLIAFLSLLFPLKFSNHSRKLMKMKYWRYNVNEAKVKALLQYKSYH